MSANLANPFGESCCDGGICDITAKSTQPCGCDPGADWLCQRHKVLKEIEEQMLKEREDEA